MKASGYVGIALAILLLFGPLASLSFVNTNGNSQLRRNTSASYTEVTRDVEFELGKSFSTTNTVSHPDYAERSASAITDTIDEYVPEGVERVTDVDVYYTDISISITQIHVIEDREFGAGSIYLNVVLNDDANKDYTFDNNGNYYVANDGDYLDVDISLTDYLYSMDNQFTITLHGWEADPDLGWPDDYMGGENLWYSLEGYSSRSIAGWCAFDEYDPDGGNNDIQIEVYIEIDFTNIEEMSYPKDFTTSNDGSYLISAVYFPKVYYDTLDSAHLVLIDCIYEEVYYGYDESIDDYAYVIFYLFYWTHETDDFGALFGHYYDYEPLLMFVRDIGEEPYRIVYRDVGDNTLPPELIVQEEGASTDYGVDTSNISTSLMPLLGGSCSVDYTITNDYYTTSAYHYETDHGLTPFRTVPYITVTNTYHQFEVGIPAGSGEAVLTPIQNYLLPLSNAVIRTGYNRLDEAFDSPINVYEGVTLWNGGDYKVPENMSLTLDLLHNPFEFPYIVDAYEDIVHYTESAQDYKENGLYYDISFDLTFAVPATLTINMPSQVTVGETYDVDIDLALDSPEIQISFAYDINLGLVLNWWFLGIDENASYAGKFDFAVNLEDMTALVKSLGFSTEDLEGEYQEGWISVSDMSTSTDLLSTMLQCEMRIHLLRILSDLLGSTSVGPVIEIVKFFLADIDLVATPTISGSMSADLETDNSAISLDAAGLQFEEGTTSKRVKMDVHGGSSTSGIRLTNMQYQLAFSTAWDVDFDFTGCVNNFVEDCCYDVGTFPSITESSDDHEVDAKTTTGYDDSVTLSVVEPEPTSSETSTSSSTSPSSPGYTDSTTPPTGGPDSMLFMGLAIGSGIAAVVVVIGYVIIRKKGE